VADSHAPWTDDFAALGERSASQLRSIAAMHAALRPEPKMSIFKRRPLFATVVALAVLALAAPIAYAIGTRVFISIDPDQTAPEIEQNVQQQLDNAGVPATVTADKFGDGNVRVQIKASPAVGSNLDVELGNLGSNAEQSQVRLEVMAQLSDPQFDQLQTVIASDAVTNAVDNDAPADAEKAVTDALAAAGFHAVTVHVVDGSLTVRVTAPPT
jgi:nitrogen regulatory protein PII